MPFDQQFQGLQAVNTGDMDVFLAIVKEYKVAGISRYTIRYVHTTENLRAELAEIVAGKIAAVQAYRDFTFDIGEPDPEEVLAIDMAETDFSTIKESLAGLLPAENYIENTAELFTAKAYMIIFRNEEGLQLISYKILAENWKLRAERGFLSLTWNGDTFDTIEAQNVFSISKNVDFINFDDTLFITSKKNFEQAMNFRAGMIARAEEFYEELTDINLFQNMALLAARVGNNQRYLRKVAMVKNLGYYHDRAYLQRLRELAEAKNWNIRFANDQIVLDESNIDEVLLLLQNKRLHSQITDEFFDVDAVRPYVGNPQT